MNSDHLTVWNGDFNFCTASTSDLEYIAIQ